MQIDKNQNNKRQSHSVKQHQIHDKGNDEDEMCETFGSGCCKLIKVQW